MINVVYVVDVAGFCYEQCRNILVVLQHDCCTDDLAVETCVPDVGLWTGIYHD